MLTPIDRICSRDGCKRLTLATNPALAQNHEHKTQCTLLVMHHLHHPPCNVTCCVVPKKSTASRSARTSFQRARIPRSDGIDTLTGPYFAHSIGISSHTPLRTSQSRRAACRLIPPNLQ